MMIMMYYRLNGSILFVESLSSRLKYMQCHHRQTLTAVFFTIFRQIMAFPYIDSAQRSAIFGWVCYGPILDISNGTSQ